MTNEVAPVSETPELTERQKFLEWLNETQWVATRHINGKGVEISNEDFLVFPRAIKLVTRDNHPAAALGFCFKVEDIWKPTEKDIPKESLDFVVLIPEDGKQLSFADVTPFAEGLKIGGRLIMFERQNDFPTVLIKSEPGKLTPWEHPVRGEKSIGIMRLGAIGDLMQTTSVIAQAKKEGYHVSVYAQKPAAEVLINNPNIDDLVMTDREIVRPAALGQYWAWLSKQFTKFVNLCESVEATYLPSTGRLSFDWPYSVRHKYMNVNYVQFMHELAEMKYRLDVKFYPTDEEIKWADEERAKMPEKKLICYAMHGSSQHKVWPYFDWLVKAALTEVEDVAFVTLGDISASMLESGWEKQERVHRRCGQWTIRQSLTFIQRHANVLVGPETGLLNAMCKEPMKKVIFLSHSTENNLTRDWTNTVNFTAPEEALKECNHCCMHRLHMFEEKFKNIKRYDGEGMANGTAWCQANILPEKVWAVVKKEILKPGLILSK